MNKILFYPYSTENNTYIGMIQRMLKKHYNLRDYQIEKNCIDNNVKAIYLNWLEDKFTIEDRKVLLEARSKGIVIIWVYHNRKSHYLDKRKNSNDAMMFLAEIATYIIVLSKRSIDYLLEDYERIIDINKVKLIPHPDYVSNYGKVISQKLSMVVGTGKFIFCIPGTIREDKNALLAIRAFKKMKNREDCILIVAGKITNKMYEELLFDEIKTMDNIVLENEKLNCYSLEGYVSNADVVVMPYDTESCMNSSIMIMAYSCGRTVITSDISMAMDYSEEQIYRYHHYKDDELNIKQLVYLMDCAYVDGRTKNREKGKKLFEDVIANNSKEIVENKLVKLIGKWNDLYIEDNTFNSIKNDIWQKKAQMLDGLLSDFLYDNKFFRLLSHSTYNRIGIYAWGKMGRYVAEQMKKYDIELTCVIDQNEDLFVEDVNVYSLNNINIPLDMVIITTPYADYETIKRKLLMLNDECYICELDDLK